MFGLQRLFDKRAIDDWREEQVLRAAATLNQLAADVVSGFEKDIASATLRESLFSQQRFLADKVAPHVQSAADEVIKQLVAAANADLGKLAQHSAVWHDRPNGTLNEQAAFDGWQDIATAGGPLAAGAAVASTLPIIGVTTTTAFFGLVTTTAISWPVVVVGGSFVGVALVTGLFKGSQLRDKSDARLRRKIHAYVVATLIKGSATSPAILEQLAQLYQDAATRAKALL